jgi:hypothetical protein
LRKLLVFFLLTASFSVSAQRNEIGLGGGVFNYAGDMMRAYPVYNVKPGIVGYYKYNFDNIFSARAALTAGFISGSDSKPIDAFAAQRNGSFNSTIVDVSAQLEFNFLNFKSDKRHIRWSPYFATGIGVFTFFGGNQDLAGTSNVQLNIPFGGGFKYAINPYLTLNLEIGIRKLFTDRLDGYSEGDIFNKNYQYGNKYDKDWFNFVGLSVSYMIWDIPCPYDFY